MTMPHPPHMPHYPKEIQWDSLIQLRPLYDMLADTRARYGGLPAFDFLGARSTWEDIARMADHIASGLQKIGIKKGDRVGILLPNCPLYLAAYYGIARTGAIIVNFNPLYAETELKHRMNDSGVRAVFTTNLKLIYTKLNKIAPDTCLEKIIVASFADMLPFPKSILFRMFKVHDYTRINTGSGHIPLWTFLQNDGVVQDVEIDPVNDVALLQYTGGTTGTPKGAMLTHANITANAQQCAMWFTDCKNGNERMLGVIPFFHVFSMTAVMNLSVLKGLEIIALPRFNINETLSLIHRRRPTLFPAVPAIFNAINHHPDLKKYDLTSLRHCISGGAPLPIEVKKNFEKNTGCILVEGYGLTETSPVTHVNPLHGVNKPGSIGLPLPQTVTEIVDPDSGTLLPQGTKGEICIRGPQVMKGYWNNPDETDKVLQDSRLKTGDIGYIDPDGYTYIVDRIKDMIITNGYNVYPRTVEEAIYEHPDVQECIVAGLPDEERGERVKAWIVLKDGFEMSPFTMKAFLQDKLSPMEMPRDIEFRTEPLPRTFIGKLSRKSVVDEEKKKIKGV